MKTDKTEKTLYRMEITATNGGGIINAHNFATLDEALDNYRNAGTGEGYTVTLEKTTPELHTKSTYQITETQNKTITGAYIITGAQLETIREFWQHLQDTEEIEHYTIERITP